MTRRLIGLLITLALGLSLAPLAAEAQPSPLVSRIGRLTSGHPPAGPDLNLEAFRQGLREVSADRLYGFERFMLQSDRRPAGLSGSRRSPGRGGKGAWSG